MKIWIDMTNSPHVPLFRPIIRDLESRGHDVVVTARDYAQTVGLLEKYNVPFQLIGRHQGGRFGRKLLGLVNRSFELFKFASKEKPDISVSHGSNDLAVASYLRSIPHLTIFDYEFIGAHHINFRLSKKILCPNVIPIEAVKRYGGKSEKVLRYEGIKEDVYVSDLVPDHGFLQKLKIKQEAVVICLRPPATLAHYQANENSLFVDILQYLGKCENIVCVVLPRVYQQAEEIKALKLSNVIIPEKAVDGLNLIFWSDIVISAGGTMNREAAALGVPVFSLYNGKIGAVDADLIRLGKLSLVTSIDDFKQIQLVKRKRQFTQPVNVLGRHVASVIETMQEGC